MKALSIKAIAAAMALVAFSACSSDGIDIDNNGVKVVTSPQMFQWNGGETEMTVDKSIASAYVDADWVTVASSGQKVTLTATANGSRESRHAKLVVKASATDSVVVSVSQLGIVFNAESATDITVTDGDTTVVVPVAAAGDIVVSQCPSWISASVTSDGLNLDISKNTTGALRGGEVEFGLGGMSRTITVVQIDIDRDIFGNYYLAHVDDTGEIDFALPVAFTRNAIDFTPSKIFVRSIPGTFDDATMSFRCYEGNLLGKYNDYFIYNLFCSSEGLVGYDTSLGGTFTFAYDSSIGAIVGTLGGPFDSSGYYTTGMMYLYAFSNMTFDSQYGAGGIAMANRLIKAGSSDEALSLARAHSLILK